MHSTTLFVMYLLQQAMELFVGPCALFIFFSFVGFSGGVENLPTPGTPRKNRFTRYRSMRPPVTSQPCSPPMKGQGFGIIVRGASLRGRHSFAARYARSRWKHAKNRICGADTGPRVIAGAIWRPDNADSPSVVLGSNPDATCMGIPYVSWFYLI